MIASGLPRTTETASLVAPEHELELWPDLREITGSKLSSIPAAELEEAFVHAFRGVVPNEKQFLGGETIGALFDRVVPALERLVADEGWDTALVVAHGAVNRAILSYVLTGERMFLGRFEQAPGCLNVLDVGDATSEWIVRAVNVAPVDLVHRSTRQTTMEQYWEQYRPPGHMNDVRGAGILPAPRSYGPIECRTWSLCRGPAGERRHRLEHPVVEPQSCTQSIGC